MKYIEFSDLDYNSNTKDEKRPYKGESLIDFPRNYVVVDIETTGFVPKYDYILEVSAIKVQNNEIVADFSYIINQPDVNMDLYSHIQALTGITQNMIDAGTDEETVLKEFAEFVNNDLIVGHNIAFDINFLYDRLLLFGIILDNDYIDTVRLAKKLLPELNHHRLVNVAEKFGIDTTGCHRALKDCQVTYSCLQNLEQLTVNEYGSVETFRNSRNKRNSTKSYYHSTHSKDIVPSVTDFDETTPFFGRVFAFTGELQMKRREAMQIVADLGGIPADSVTKKTNFLVLGNNDYCPLIKDGKSAKQKKAEKLMSEGQDICIITEEVFMDMLSDTLNNTEVQAENE